MLFIVLGIRRTVKKIRQCQDLHYLTRTYEVDAPEIYRSVTEPTNTLPLYAIGVIEPSQDSMVDIQHRWMSSNINDVESTRQSTGAGSGILLTSHFVTLNLPLPTFFS